MAIKIHSIMSEPRILLYDVEMSYSVAYHYDQWGVNIPHTHIKHPQFMISAAWKWYGQKKIHTVSVLDDKKRFKKNFRDDYHVINTLREEILDADATVAFNGDRFDTKELNTGMVKHGLKPLHNYIQIDPLKIAKSKFRFKGGNSLDNLCKALDVGVQKGKIDNKTWFAATEGCEKAINKVVRYNKGDIPTMEAVWEKIRPYAPSKLNMNLFVNANVCSNCASPNLQLAKRRKCAKSTIRYQYQCQDCGTYTTTGKAIKTTELR